MSALRVYLILLSALSILISFSTPMRLFIHYATLAEVYAKTNGQIFYPLAGVLWVLTGYVIVKGFLHHRPKAGKFWVVPSSVLSNWTKNYSPVENDKYLVVSEVKNETPNT